MKTAKYALVLGGIVGAASMARADLVKQFGPVTLTATPQGTPTDNIVPPDVAPGYTAYLITLSTNDGSKITAVNFGGTPDGHTGFTGDFLQQADIGRGGTTSPTPVEPDTNVPPGLYSVDSHFLVPASGRDDVAAPTEDNDLKQPVGAPTDVPGAGGADWGTGHSLTGVFGLANQSSSIPLAYLVVPVGQTFNVNGAIATSSSSSAIEIPTTAVGVTVPEPASLGLVGLAGLASLRRRRA